MAKIYGGRWQVLEDAGRGGQGVVFRVADLRDGGSNFALKRLSDINRLDRFRREIEALKSSSHSNIVQLIDHSDLSSPGPGEKHFLVMPFAAAGDAEKRRDLFKGSIENVVKVAIQVAKALEAAHELEIVHRDVKPANILFPSESLDVWLSDFGICRFGNEELTPTGVIVGARRFSAPEVEAGNLADVPKGVDFYSLGQVMMYLLSGGVTFHREHVFAPDLDVHFEGGQRSDLLRVLLSRMVAPQDSRYGEAHQVIEGLAGILDWEARAFTRAVGQDLRSKIAHLRLGMHEADSRRAAEKEEAQRVAALETAVLAAATSTIEAQLQSFAEALMEGNDLVCSVERDTALKTIEVAQSQYHCDLTFVLRVKRVGKSETAATLLVTLCTAGRRPVGPKPRALLAILMVSGAAMNLGILGEEGLIAATAGSGRIAERPDASRRLRLPDGSRPKTKRPKLVRFDAGKWPEVEPELSSYCSEAFDTFLDTFVAASKR